MIVGSRMAFTSVSLFLLPVMKLTTWVAELDASDAIMREISDKLVFQFVVRLNSSEALFKIFRMVQIGKTNLGAVKPPLKRMLLPSGYWHTFTGAKAGIEMVISRGYHNTILIDF